MLSTCAASDCISSIVASAHGPVRFENAGDVRVATQFRSGVKSKQQHSPQHTHPTSPQIRGFHLDRILPQQRSFSSTSPSPSPFYCSSQFQIADNSFALPTRIPTQGEKKVTTSTSRHPSHHKQFHLVKLIDPTITRMDSDSTSSSSQSETVLSDNTTTNTSQTTAGSIRSSVPIHPKEFFPRSHSICKPTPLQTPPPSVIGNTPSSPSVSEQSETTVSSILSTAPSGTTITTDDETTSQSHIKEDILLTMTYSLLR
jgi:hypothetical protein